LLSVVQECPFEDIREVFSAILNFMRVRAALAAGFSS
jgi:hypothetical protein